ncbi:MAG TPA: SCO family protein [Bryobacteraceae bacterium]|nr:SCO family protein [Bryobacteraceae bacterium]
MKSVLKLRLVLAAFALLAGCGGSGPKHYALRGRVLTKSPDQLTVSHEDIPGFMPAMTMAYAVKDAAGFQKVEEGDAIAADLVADQKQNPWLEHLVVTDSSGRDTIHNTTADDLEPGSEIPDVELVNQDGKKIHLGAFKGKAVLITFIYTRCPFPTFCPLLSNEFASLHRELLKTPGDYKKTHLVSVSLDPSFDTPAVLRKYGLSYLRDDPAGFEHWDFVATAPADLKKLAAAFGLTYFEKDNQITHSLRTVLLAPDGTVEKIWSGNQYRKDEILDSMRQAGAAQAR